MSPSRHPSDLENATIAFIKSLRLHEIHHAVIAQRLVDDVTGDVHEHIVIHRRPNAVDHGYVNPLWDRELPEQFNGFPVTESPWPT